MKNLRLLIPIILVLLSCQSQKFKASIKIFTSEGTITIGLYPEQAPITVTNFLEHIENKEFDNKSFYRTVKMDNQPENEIKIQVIQGGVGFFESDKNLNPIQHESTNETGILHLDGTISMARVDTGTATTEFFICVGNQPALDFGGFRNPDGQGFAAFGKVTSGMHIVHKIHQKADTNQFYINPVKIDSIRILH